MSVKLTRKLALMMALLYAGQTLFAQDTTKATINKVGQTPFAQSLDSTKVKSEASNSSKVDTAKKLNTLIISLEFRPRTEFRHGYRTLMPYSDTGAAFFTGSRTRLNFAYSTKNFDLYTSLTDVYVWGQNDARSNSGPGNSYFQLFEMYAEPHFSNKFSVRFGRQRISYDNQRLFSENDWRQLGHSHDALKLIYNNKINFTNEFSTAFNQSKENVFSTKYMPLGFVNYKVLLVDYLNWKLSKNFVLTTINAADGYQSSDPAKYKTTYMRFTNGGRIEYNSYNWYLTMSGYYQYGKDSSGRKLDAYYIQPEIKYSGIKNLAIRLGFQYMSGQDATKVYDGNGKPYTTDNSFVPLYTTGHGFNGSLDWFGNFPADLGGAGLVNPYLFFWYTNNKLTVRFDNHLFYSQNNYVYQGSILKKFLAYENDWRVIYKVNSFITIDGGFSWALPTRAFGIIRKGDYKKTQYWSYVMFRFTPTIGKFTF